MLRLLLRLYEGTMRLKDYVEGVLHYNIDNTLTVLERMLRANSTKRSHTNSYTSKMQGIIEVVQRRSVSFKDPKVQLWSDSE